MQSFPQPLSTQEEEQLLQGMREGDLSCRNRLIEHNLRLVAHVVKKYNNTIYETDDLISIGTIGLIKAVDSFNKSKGIRLATYASRCIENELLMLMRSSKKQSREVSLFDPIGSDKEGNTIQLLDICVAEEIDVIEQMEEQQQLKKLHDYIDKVLTSREKEIILLRYGLKGGKEVTQRQIADKLHISRSYVSRIEKKALKKLKAAYMR
ncbi:MAG: RNA polymerase sporulation sigma factor SigK [Lachnospiraceae bacterium]|nr:RNA polymerase sporulation sigma factor SigK [Lachnospiraceae bacterium]